MKAIAWIARIGQSASFVAFMAHCWFAAFFTYVALDHEMPMLPVLAFLAAAAAAKEFGFDAREETGQTFDDNLEDFVGYVVGGVIAALVHSFL